MKDIKVGVKKMTRNRRKMIKKTADSLLLAKHSIQFSALFLLLSGFHFARYFQFPKISLIRRLPVVAQLKHETLLEMNFQKLMAHKCNQN